METNLEEAKRVKIREQVGILLVCLVLAGSGILLLREKPQAGSMSFSSGDGKTVENAPKSTTTSDNAAATNTNSSVSTKININTASLEDLDKLPGVGPATAQKIIDYRNQNGPFPNIEAIDNVSGIGPSKYSQMKDLITI